MDFNSDYVRKYPFHCVQFKKRGRQSGTKMIDIVPTKNFVIEKASGKKENKPKKVQVWFPPPPYTSQSTLEYDKHLKELSDVPESWDLFSVVVKGRAENLKEALEKLSNLKTQDNAWSMSDATPEESEVQAIESIRRAKLLAQSNTLVQAHQQHVIPTINSEDHNVIDCDRMTPRSTSALIAPQFERTTSVSRIVPPEQSSIADHSPLVQNGLNFSIVDSSCEKSAPPKRPKGSAKTSKSYSKNSSTDGPNIDLVTTLLSEVKEMRNDIKTLNDNVDNLKRAMSDGAGIVPKDFIGNTNELGERFKYRFPILTLDEFDRFELELANPQSTLKNHLMVVLQAGLDRKYLIPKSSVNMLKMIIGKSVALQYVTQKASHKVSQNASQKTGTRKDPTRLLIKTQLYACMDSLIRSHRLTNNGMITGLTEVSVAVGAVLTNANRWPEDDKVTVDPLSCQSRTSITTVMSAPSAAQIHALPIANSQVDLEVIEVLHQDNPNNSAQLPHDGVSLIVYQEDIREPPAKQQRTDVNGNLSNNTPGEILGNNRDSSAGEDSDEEGDNFDFLSQLQDSDNNSA